MIFSKAQLGNILQSKFVAGVEIILSPNGVSKINYVILKKHKKRLIIDSSGHADTVESLLQNIPPTQPILLSVDGKGIIHKMIAFTENETDASLLNKILPTASTAEFYLQKKASAGSIQFLSLIRKTTADLLLDEFKKQKNNIIGFYLGPFLFSSLIALLDNASTQREITIPGYKLVLDEQEIIDFEYFETIQRDPIRLINGEVIQPNIVIAFCTAIHYFISGTKDFINIPTVVMGNKEFIDKQLFKYVSTSIIIFFAFCLLINFFLFSSISRTYNEYNTTTSLNQNMLMEYEKMQKEVKQKQEFLQQTGLSESSKTSYYADQIAQSLPNTILLTQINIFPLEKLSNTNEQEMQFKSGIILISGNCKKSFELNEWMSVLKKTNWIEEVSILNFSQNTVEKIGNFSIEVKIK